MYAIQIVRADDKWRTSVSMTRYTFRTKADAVAEVKARLAGFKSAMLKTAWQPRLNRGVVYRCGLVATSFAIVKK